VSFYNAYKEDNYLLNLVFFYLKPFHHSKFGVPKKNPFGSIEVIVDVSLNTKCYLNLALKGSHDA
jgi:hypothetical protein